MFSAKHKSGNYAQRGDAIGGTGKHNYVTSLLDRYQRIYGNRGLEIGLYFNNGVGNRAILYVIDYANGIIYDFKFGNAVMSPMQYNKYYIYGFQ